MLFLTCEHDLEANAGQCEGCIAIDEVVPFPSLSLPSPGACYSGRSLYLHHMPYCLVAGTLELPWLYGPSHLASENETSYTILIRIWWSCC